MSKQSSYTIDWDITYEKAGDSVGWTAQGWSKPDNQGHTIKGTNISPYWHDTLEEARQNAWEVLRDYTDDRRFEYDNKERVTL